MNLRGEPTLMRRLFWSSLFLLSACGGGGSSPSAPGAPTIGQVTPGDRALTVAFSAPTSDGGAPVTSYTANCRGGLLDSNSVTGSASPVTVNGLVNGREYSCSVTARNTAGEGPASSAVTATPYTTPGAPALGTLAAGDGVIDATFSAPTDNGGSAVTEYRLGCTSNGSTRSVTGATSPLRLAGVTNGTAYSCAVTARNAAGEGAASAAQTVTPRTMPGAPTIAAVAADAWALVVNAGVPASDGGAPITGYTAQCTGGGNTLSGSSPSTRIPVAGLVNGTAYSCIVRATNAVGDGPWSAPVSGTPRDLSREARLTSTIDQTTRRATVTWRDVFPSGTTYRVESGPPGATLTSRGVVATGTGGGATLSWSTDVTDTMVIRVFAVRQGLGDLPLMSEIMESFVFVAYVSPTAPPAILIDTSEPVSGIVRLSIAGGVTYSWVDWFVGTTKLGTVMHTEGPGNPITWNSNSVATGDHVLIARIQTASNSVTELRRVVRVAHINIFPSERLFDGVYFLVADVSSAAGIASVEARVDGVTLGTLTAPNCPQCGDGAARSYRWRLDPSRFPSGTYRAAVTAVDRSGLRKTVEQTIQIRYPPVLIIDQPTDFQIFNGRLELRGRVTSDRAGTVRTVVNLEQLTLLDTTSQTLDFSLDLSGLAPRVYRLTITSRDSANVPVTVERTIVITGSPERVYVPALTLDPTSTPVHSDGRRLLWQGGDGEYRLQAFGAAAVILRDSHPASLPSADRWQVANGRVYAQGKGADCVVLRCIYEWDPTGTRRNLSAASPFQSLGGASCIHVEPLVRGDSVLWANSCGPGSLTLYNALSAAFLRIDVPSGASGILDRPDLAPDGVSVVFWSRTGTTADGFIAQVYRYRGGTSTRLTSSSDRNTYPATNGTRVAWQRTPSTSDANLQAVADLMVLDLDAAAPRSVATGVEDWRFADQVLAWSEVLERNRFSQVTKRVLKVEYNGVVHTMTTNIWGRLLVNSGSHVLFKENESFYRWSGGAAQTVMMLEAVPTHLWAANGYVVFTVGGGRIYRLPLP